MDCQSEEGRPAAHCYQFFFDRTPLNDATPTTPRTYGKCGENPSARSSPTLAKGHVRFWPLGRSVLLLTCGLRAACVRTIASALAAISRLR